VRLLAATGEAVAVVEDAGTRETLTGGGPRCVAVAEGTAIAGGRDGVRLSDDAGESWRDGRLPAPDVYSVAVGADGALYAGTEPSALFRSDDGGASWRELEALRALPSAPTWSFPPRPWTSHVRWIAPSPHDPGVVLAGIELGGLMRSADGGETWADHRPGAQRDVHSLAWHPHEPGHAYEAGGGGAARSDDGGETWNPADEGRDRHYVWAVAVDPADPGRWYVSASTGPFAAHGRGPAQARIYRRDGVAPWEALGGDFDSMPYALCLVDGRLVAGLRDGTLLALDPGGWTELAALPSVLALAA
jgi:photosystem II stability/assembly factor-like uncharacterized protein